MFITFEGIDGCGKTTQVQLLAECLRGVGHKVITTREPGGCFIAEEIRSILKDPSHTEMVPMAELMLFAAGRAQHIEEIVRPALKSGHVVLCDRFTDSTRAFQGVRLGKDYQGAIEGMIDLATAGLEPDLTVFLDLQPEEAAGRMQVRQACRIDSEGIDFHRKVRLAYLDLAKRYPRRFVVVDASGTPMQVFDHIVYRLNLKSKLFRG